MAATFVRLCEVDSRGRSWNVADGIQRTVVHDDAHADAVHEVMVDLTPTAYRFDRGTRVRVQVSAGAHPRYARNTGSRVPLADATERDLRVTNLLIVHDSAHPSGITLPVLTPESTNSH